MSRCANRPRSGGACATCMKAAWIVTSLSSSLRRFALFPEEVERSILFLELRTPDVIELTDFLREETPGTSEETLQQMARALVGLTLDEARYALRRAIARGRRLGPESLHALLEEKSCWSIAPAS